MSLSDVLERRWRYGGPWDVWIRYHDVIKELITAGKLQAVPHENFPGAAAPAAQQAMMAVRPIPFPGGMRIPHFHFGDGIYLVDERQWGQFTDRVVKDLTARLSAAKHVSFEQMMDVADAVQGIS